MAGCGGSKAVVITADTVPERLRSFDARAAAPSRWDLGFVVAPVKQPETVGVDFRVSREHLVADRQTRSARPPELSPVTWIAQAPDYRAYPADYMREAGEIIEVRVLASGGAGEVVLRLHFAVDSARVHAAQIPEPVVARLRRAPAVFIAGHTDSSGQDAYNQALSERRARAVRQALVARGVAPSRIQAFGVGESQPVATNATEPGRAANRRAEVSR